MNPPVVKRDRSFYRFILAGFLHAGLIHLVFNMITLYSFGPIIEEVFVYIFGNKYGPVSYFVFYLLAIIISDIPYYFKHQNDKQDRHSLGASGAVSAVIFIAILFYPTSKLAFFFIPMPAFVFGILYLIYTSYETLRDTPMAAGINHSAHLWGAIFGIFTAIVLVPGVVPHFTEAVLNWRPF
jgi:membrane associated rhomboid family serine protease